MTPGNLPGLAVATYPTRIYADPGTPVNLTIFPTSGSATVICNVAISGTITALK
jgi:hypothetical protein